MVVSYLFLLSLTIIIVYIIYRINTDHAFNYNFKFFGLFMMVMTTAVVIFPYICLYPRDVQNIRFAGKLWHHIFKRVGLNYEIRNGEYLKSDKPYILLCNHQSSIDVIAMMEFLPDRCTALAKKSLLYFGPFGISSWLAGLVFVDRLNREKAKETMDSTAKMLHSKNIKLWVFPEGTRNQTGTLLPFKKGAFHLAVQAQVPIVPLVLSSYRHFLNATHKYFTEGDVMLTVLPPISTEGLTSDDVNDLTQKAYDQMKVAFEQSSAEIDERARKAGKTTVLDLMEKKQD